MGDECVAAVKKIASLVVDLAVGAKQRGVDFLLRTGTAASCVGGCDEELVVDLEADLDGEVEEAGFVRFLLSLDCGSHDDCCV